MAPCTVVARRRVSAEHLPWRRTHVLMAGRTQGGQCLAQQPRLLGGMCLVTRGAGATLCSPMHEHVGWIGLLLVAELTQRLGGVGAQQLGAVRTMGVVTIGAAAVSHRLVY